VDYLGEKVCYRWMFITFFGDTTLSDGGIPDENTAADADRRWVPDRTNHPKQDGRPHPDRAYGPGTKFRIHRGNKGIDNRVIRDNGKGWVLPRLPGYASEDPDDATKKDYFPDGVDSDEWIDLWRNGGSGTPEWDLVEMDVADDCPCPDHWSENSSPPKPQHMLDFEKAQAKKAKTDEARADNKIKLRQDQEKKQGKPARKR
jgi:hypothetical protein